MNFIVTGGLGFIGSHLVEKLLADSHNQVLIVDDLSNNTVDSSFFKELRLASIAIDTVKSFFNSMSNPFNSQIDIVFHLASIVGPSGVLKYPGDIAQNIIVDSTLIRDFCMFHNALFVDISSSEIYGHASILSESSAKIFLSDYQVRTEYGASKMLSEISLVNKAKSEPNLKYHIIRPFNVIGKRQKPDCGFVLPRFVIAALTGQPFTIFGDGLQKRAFTDVDDICNAIIKIAFSDFKNEIWNVGNPNNLVNICHLASLVSALSGNLNPVFQYLDPKIIFGDLFSDVPDKIPSIDKISSLLNWYPLISLTESIDKVIAYYKAKIDEGYYYKVI